VRETKKRIQNIFSDQSASNTEPHVQTHIYMSAASMCGCAYVCTKREFKIYPTMNRHPIRTTQIHTYIFTNLNTYTHMTHLHRRNTFMHININSHTDTYRLHTYTYTHTYITLSQEIRMSTYIHAYTHMHIRTHSLHFPKIPISPHKYTST